MKRPPDKVLSRFDGCRTITQTKLDPKPNPNPKPSVDFHKSLNKKLINLTPDIRKDPQSFLESISKANYGSTIHGH